MNNQEDQTWQALLRLSRDTFAVEAAPPFGFVTAAMAQVRADKRQQLEFERIGWRALFASLATLVLVAGMTAFVQTHHQSDLEPGMRGLIEVENVPLS